ncbi:MAG TPA: carbohydrate-binding protein [Chitinolyticbacter sp.]|nr:carbohydrate-binding protein [Chitinolyticbacter sp.]
MQLNRWMKLAPALLATALAHAAPGWDAVQVYTAGMVVNYDGQDWKAKWWTQGDVPGAAQWGPWEAQAAVTPTPVTVTPTVTPSPVTATPTPTPLTPSPTPVSPTPVTPTPVTGNSPAWQASVAYAGGQRVCLNGILYEAIWWVQGERPDVSNPWGPWRKIGTCPVGPTTPTPVTPTPVTPTPVTPTPGTARITAVKVEIWRNGAAGAYSMVHDDFCYEVSDSHINVAEPALYQRGLVAAFAAVTSACQPAHWTAAQTFVAHGHELANHTRTHLPSSAAGWQASAEIGQSTQDIARHLNGYQPSYLVWPNDTATYAALAALRNTAGYLGARASNRDFGGGNIQYGLAAGVNDAQFNDPFMVQWDLFTATNQWSLYPSGELLNLHVDAAISKGGWATRTMHGVGTVGYEPVPVARYLAHLDYVKGKVDAGLLWVATPSDVIRYRYAREACAPTLAADGKSLSFPSGNAQCQKYATPITLELTATGAIAPRQGTTVLPVIDLGNGRYRVTVLPSAGALNL